MSTADGKKTKRFFGLIALVFIVPLLTLCAGGAQEGKAGDRLSEKAVTVDVYAVETKTPSSSMPSAVPGGQAAFYLFQSFRTADGGARISSEREFSMPIQEKEKIDFSPEYHAVYYSLEITPKEPLTYTLVQRIAVSFDYEDLLSNDRIRMQPAKMAAFKALEKTKKKEGLARVADLSMDEKGRFKAQVEIAERAASR